MHRLTVFEHNVVGDVNDVVDRTDAGGTQLHAEPQRRGSDLDILDNAGRVTVAVFGVGDLDVEVVGDIVTVCGSVFVLRGGEIEFLAEGNSGFTCETENGETVGTVGGDFEFHNGIAETERFDHICAERDIVETDVVEDQDAVFDCAGHVVEGQTEFGDGAEHTFGNFAAELALLDLHVARKMCAVAGNRNNCAFEYVGSGGDDLDGSVDADVNLADNETFCVGVTGDFKNLTADNAGDVVADFFKAFNLASGHGHPVAVIFYCNIADIGIVSEPFHGKLHGKYTFLCDFITSNRCTRSGCSRSFP